MGGRVGLIALLASTTFLRLVYCFHTPLYTTDALRNLGYGIEYWRYGLQIYDMTPFDFSPESYQFLWPNYHYTYPVVTLLFFAGIAKIWPCVFFLKLVLTLLDFLNSGLIYKFTRDKWCAIFYFCNPIGIWFVSHEGQFESMVNFLMLLSLYHLQKGNPVSFGFLSLAIQTKLIPMFLTPYALYVIWRRSFRNLGLYLIWGIVGIVPSLAAMTYSQYLQSLLHPGYVPENNPLSWALFQTGLHAFTPFWLVFFHGLAGAFFIVLILYYIRQEKNFFPYLASLLFIILVKSSVIGQFWYMLLTPVLCLTVENSRHRRILVGISLLFGMRSFWSIVFGPIGYITPFSARIIFDGYMF